MDLSHLSDADLEKLAGPTEHEKAVAGMSDEDLQKIVSGKPLDPKYSATQSAVMHGINKATGGFSDELQGLGEAAGRVVGVHGAGGPIKDMHLAEGGPTHDWAILKDAYQRARDHERQALAQQSKEHPVASAAGDITGAVVSPVNKVAKGMSLAKAGATLGGINALGSTEKEDLPGMAVDTAKGVGIGALAGKALDVAAPAVRGAIDEVATAPLGPNVPTPQPATPSGPLDPFTKRVIQGGRSALEQSRQVLPSLPPEAPTQSLIGSAMRGIQSAGEKANATLENIPKWMRYVAPGPGKYIQAGVDAAEKGPAVAQSAAGVAANGMDKVGQFLSKSPRLQELSQNSPKAFSALAASIGQRAQPPMTNVARPNQPPVDDEQAKQAFLDGN